jgi:hypothetical protein
VSLDGAQLLVGAPRDNQNGYNSGSAYVFSFAAKDLDGDGICDCLGDPGGSASPLDDESQHDSDGAIILP